jgi:hypothetical protein
MTWRRMTTEPGKTPHCAVCRQPITDAECEYHVNNRHTKKHIGCTPKTRAAVMEDATLARAPDVILRGKGPKRRRAGGSGYTGGDGYKTIR